MDIGHAVLAVTLVGVLVLWVRDYQRLHSQFASTSMLLNLEKEALQSAEDSAKSHRIASEKKDGEIECLQFENHRLREFIEAFNRQSEGILSGDDDFDDTPDGVAF